VRADRFHSFDSAVRCRGRIGLGYGATSGPDRGKATDGQTAAAQESAAVDGFPGDLRQDPCPLGASRNPVGLFPKHVFISSRAHPNGFAGY